LAAHKTQHATRTGTGTLALILCTTFTATQLTATAGCGHFRTYTDYSYKKIGEEKKTVTLPEKSYDYQIVYHDEAYWLKITEITHCQDLVQEVLEERATIETKAPLAWWYIGGGSLMAGLSAPFYYLAAGADTPERTRNNALVGSFLFLLPGLALLGFGIYQKLASGTETDVLGTTKKTKTANKRVCETGPVVDQKVIVGTRTGTQPMGKTNEKGEIRLPHRTIKPLIRYRFHKIVKVYLDVFLGTKNLGEADVPWPTRRPQE
jgi:hypothetical protein